MSEKKYTIELTETQLCMIAECVEDCHRFMAGQVELQNMTSRLDEYRKLQDGLRELKPLVTPAIPERGASYKWSGTHCPNEHQRKFIAQTYPIYREIYHFFAVSKGLDNVYASETLTCADGGEPIKIKAL